MAQSIFSKKDGEEVRINLTPMIDAVFLLLIFFMVTTVFTQSQQLRIELPRAAHYDQLKEKKLNLSIASEGQLEINGRLVDAGELAGWLESEKTRTSAATLVIKADAKTQHGYVLDVMEIANQVGIEQISVETDELRKDRRD